MLYVRKRAVEGLRIIKWMLLTSSGAAQRIRQTFRENPLILKSVAKKEAAARAAKPQNVHREFANSRLKEDTTQNGLLKTAAQRSDAAKRPERIL